MKKIPNITPLSGLALACALAFNGTAQAEWIKSYGTPNEDIGYAMPTSNNGGFLSMTSISSRGTSSSSLLSLLDSNGNPAWTKNLSAGGKGDTLFINELKSGRLLLQGTSQQNATAPNNALWAVYNVNRNTGALTPVFRRMYKQGGSDFGLIEASPGVLLGSGSATLANKGTDMIVARINANSGLPVWSRILHNDYSDEVSHILPKGEQFILIGNSSAKNATGTQQILIGLLSRQGLPVAGSFKKYGGAGTNFISGINAVSGGNYLVYGSSQVGAGLEQSNIPFILKLNSNLGFVWGKKIDLGADKDFSVTNVEENANGSLTVTGQLSESEFIDTGIPGIPPIPVPGGGKQSPAVLQMSATGAVTSGKSFSYQEMDTAYFFKQNDSSYLLSGQTSPSLDFSGGGGIGGILNSLDKSDGIYGRFNTSFSQDWVKTLVGPKSDTVGIQAFAGGYSLTGTSNSWGAGGRDVLVGVLDANGDVPGCEFINDVTMTETALTATSSDLGWTAQNTTVAAKGSIKRTDIVNANIKVTNGTLKVTDVCKN